MIVAKFLPFIRTFAPIFAGIGKMRYKTFLLYNIIGAFIWVTSITFAGYFFGGLPIVRENFEYAVVGIIIISLIPIFIEYIKHKHKTKKQKATTSYKKLQETFKKEHLNE